MSANHLTLLWCPCVLLRPRLAPLSEGRIDAAGTLMCSYHGGSCRARLGVSTCTPSHRETAGIQQQQQQKKNVQHKAPFSRQTRTRSSPVPAAGAVPSGAGHIVPSDFAGHPLPKVRPCAASCRLLLPPSAGSCSLLLAAGPSRQVGSSTARAAAPASHRLGMLRRSRWPARASAPA